VCGKEIPHVNHLTDQPYVTGTAINLSSVRLSREPCILRVPGGRVDCGFITWDGDELER
jgi:hypothetical protein